MRLVVEAARPRSPTRPAALPGRRDGDVHRRHQPGDRGRPRNLGIGELSFFSRIHHGGGAACGRSSRPCWRSTPASPTTSSPTGGSTSAPGTGSGRGAGPPADGHRNPPTSPGTRRSAAHPAQWVAMFRPALPPRIRGHQRRLRSHRGRDRKHAANNPKAWFYEQPITLEDHQNSRWIVEPLHLLDCCQGGDGAQAIVRDDPGTGQGPRATPVVVNAAPRARREPGHDDQLLPGVDHRPPRDGPRRPPALEHDGLTPNDVQAHHLRPLHARRPAPSSKSSLCARVRRRTSSGTATSTRRTAADQHQRAPARRGLHPGITDREGTA